MRAREFIVEGPFDTDASPAQSLGTAAGAVKAGVDQFKSNYNRGAAAMDKVLTPSKWGSGSAASSKQSKIQPQVIRQSLLNASAGKPLYHDDIAALKSVYADAPDEATALAIKAAYTGKPLTSEQKNKLAVMSKQY
jgi:hypothetical protein